jgi:hypothetical protein
MHKRTRIGVVASPGSDAEARVFQLALDADGTFDLVACTSGLERSKVPNSATRTYSSPAEFVLGEKSIHDDSALELVYFVCPGPDEWIHVAEYLETGQAVAGIDPILPLDHANIQEAFLCAAARNKFLLGFPVTCFPMFRELVGIVHDASFGEVRSLDVVVHLPSRNAGTAIRILLSFLAGILQALGKIEVNKVWFDISAREASSAMTLNFLLQIGAQVLSTVRGLTSTRRITSRCDLEIGTTSGTLSWSLRSPDSLICSEWEGHEYILRRGNNYTRQSTRSLTHLPPGNPEGMIQALGSLIAWSRDVLVRGITSADRVADLGITDSGELEKVNRLVTTVAERVCSR